MALTAGNYRSSGSSPDLSYTRYLAEPKATFTGNEGTDRRSATAGITWGKVWFPREYR